MRIDLAINFKAKRGVFIGTAVAKYDGEIVYEDECEYQSEAQGLKHLLASCGAAKAETFISDGIVAVEAKVKAAAEKAKKDK